MRKLLLGAITIGVLMNLSACNLNKDTEEKSVSPSSVEQTIEDTSAKTDQKMEKMKEDLEEKGVNISKGSYLYFTREKGIDHDYFEMTFIFSSNEILQVWLTLKGNIDGEEKEDLIYAVNKGRLVESSGDNTDIDALADVLNSLDYTDKELVEFAEWYNDNN